MSQFASLSAQQAEILDQLRPRVTISLNGLLEIWGPTTKFQYDCDGIVPLQKYVSLLVKLHTGDWILVKRIDDLTSGHVWTRPPFFTTVTEQEARQFIDQLAQR